MCILFWWLLLNSCSVAKITPVVEIVSIVEIIPTSFEIVQGSELLCDWCDVEFKNTVEKIFHQKNIKEKVPLVCGFCGFKSCTIEWLQIHNKTKHSNQSKSQRIDTKTKFVQEKALHRNEKNPEPVLDEPEIILPDEDNTNRQTSTNVILSSVQSNSTNAPPPKITPNPPIEGHQNSKLQEAFYEFCGHCLEAIISRHEINYF